jgi:2-amino-4-hydroxy-6-hydroxymethyldihydropteridine diphosphokinase
MLYKNIPVALSLGCNLGDRQKNIITMEQRLREILQGPYISSSLMETVAVDVPEKQPSYLNRLFCGTFSGNAEQLLEKCVMIELELGRTDKGAKKARTADIDIILFGNLKLSGEKLTIPHPQLFTRRFCIEGLCEIVPEWKVPGTGFTIIELYDTIRFAVKDQKIEKITA